MFYAFWAGLRGAARPLAKQAKRRPGRRRTRNAARRLGVCLNRTARTAKIRGVQRPRHRCTRTHVLCVLGPSGRRSEAAGDAGGWPVISRRRGWISRHQGAGHMERPRADLRLPRRMALNAESSPGASRRVGAGGAARRTTVPGAHDWLLRTRLLCPKSLQKSLIELFVLYRWCHKWHYRMRQVGTIDGAKLTPLMVPT